jgi:hypothetical protein
MAGADTKPVEYDWDCFAWLVESAELLREGRVEVIDLAHLAEELEDMGRSERRAVESYLKVLIVHLLKWRYRPERRGASWKLSVTNACDAILRRLQDSPSLARALPEMVAARCQNARRHTAPETGVALDALPETCPFTLVQPQDEGYWPE